MAFTAEMASKNSVIMKYITDRPGLTIYLDDIANETGLEPRAIQKTVSNLRASARNKPTHPMNDVDDVVRGHAWIYKPNHQQAAKQAHVPTLDEVPDSIFKDPGPPAVQVKPAPKGETFTFVGKIPGTTTPVVKDERGNLFKVVPLE